MRVRGCVTLGGAPAAAGRVAAWTAGEGRGAGLLAPDGGLFVGRRVGGVNSRHASVPGRGGMGGSGLPVAGTRALVGPRLAGEGVERARFRSDDAASRLAARVGWFLLALRGRPSRETLQAALTAG